jgi:spore maturation protein CgeB
VNLVYLTHSLVSCWNHGNAHFLRGVLRELIAAGHSVRALEPEGAWSLANLLADHGPVGLDAFRSAYPELTPETYGPDFDLDAALAGADVVIVHEWNEPALVAAVGRAARSRPGLLALFHDTHHRAVSDPQAIRAFDLDGYDGILAFGRTLADVYEHWGWKDRAFVWHEAADTRLFRPPELEREREGLVWIGNWGDEERSAELAQYLFRPAREAGLGLDVYGVRYPEHALATLAEHGVRYHGWAPNAAAPQLFARHLATVHVPRRFYAEHLPGIPTIRVFEALACGIPLLSAPWEDSEGLFTVGRDFLMAKDGEEMTGMMRALRDDLGLRQSLATHGLATIHTRHSCAHRAAELLDIVRTLRGSDPAASRTMVA